MMRMLTFGLLLWFLCVTFNSRVNHKLAIRKRTDNSRLS
uniref:Uncharacterized protein n=1 Tax=Arundo donax TaxID=35708 RepID=A0A0A8Y464_ARUDO